MSGSQDTTVFQQVSRDIAFGVGQRSCIRQTFCSCLDTPVTACNNCGADIDSYMLSEPNLIGSELGAEVEMYSILRVATTHPVSTPLRHLLYTAPFALLEQEQLLLHRHSLHRPSEFLCFHGRAMTCNHRFYGIKASSIHLKFSATSSTFTSSTPHTYIHTIQYANHHLTIHPCYCHCTRLSSSYPRTCCCS